MDDQFLMGSAFHFAASKNTSRRNRIREMFSVFLEFFQSNGLTTRVILEKGKIPDETIIIMRSDLTDEGYQIFLDPFVKWLRGHDRGKPISDISVMEKALAKMRNLPYEGPKDPLLAETACLFSCSINTGFRNRIREMFSVLIDFLQSNGLTTRTILEKGQIPDETLKIRKSDLTAEGYRVFKSSYLKWFRAVDNGMPVNDMSLMEEALSEIRSRKK